VLLTALPYTFYTLLYTGNNSTSRNNTKYAFNISNVSFSGLSSRNLLDDAGQSLLSTIADCRLHGHVDAGRCRCSSFRPLQLELPEVADGLQLRSAAVGDRGSSCLRTVRRAQIPMEDHWMMLAGISRSVDV